jgi:histidinol-phosphate/aromatic aminotransferase/cobyric acid decarboxylase-like protein
MLQADDVQATPKQEACKELCLRQQVGSQRQDQETGRREEKPFGVTPGRLLFLTLEVGVSPMTAALRASKQRRFVIRDQRRTGDCAKRRRIAFAGQFQTRRLAKEH